MSSDEAFTKKNEAYQELLSDQCNNHEDKVVIEENKAQAALFAALAKCQGALSKVARGSTADTGKFSYSYSTIGEILDVAREPLEQNGLSIVQMPQLKDNHVSVTTILAHKDGGSLSSTLTMPVVIPLNASGNPAMNEAQACGSIITYARRYQLAGFLAISQEDSDAHGSSKNGSARMASQKQQEFVKTLIQKNWNWNDFGDHFKVEKLSDMTAKQASDAIEHLQSMVSPQGVE